MNEYTNMAEDPIKESLPNTKRSLEIVRQKEPARIQPSNRITSIGFTELLELEVPPRKFLLAPWLQEQGLTMIHAPRGLGKTHFAHSVAYAVASGGSYLGWQAPETNSVLLIDGELPLSLLQERLSQISRSNEAKPLAKFNIITPDQQPSGMLDLSSPEDQAELEPHLEGITLIVIDNLATLCRGRDENDGQSWIMVQDWLLKQRAVGRSVLIVHHTGKSGQMRGSSRMEDVLDTVVSLKHPSNYSPEMGACFNVEFSKARGFFGEDAKPFYAELKTNPDGIQTWNYRNLDGSKKDQIVKLLNEGKTQTQVAKELGITQGSVSKAKKRMDFQMEKTPPQNIPSIFEGIFS